MFDQEPYFKVQISPLPFPLHAGYLHAEKLRHRVFEPLMDICFVFMATFRAIEAAGGIFRTWPEDEWMSMQSILFPGIHIGIPVHNILELALQGVFPEYIKLGLLCYQAERGQLPIFSRFYNRFVAAYFVQFVDPWLDWLRINISTDYPNWPRISKFARVVRNAASHGGTINIRNENSVGGTWYSLSYDHTSFGRSIFGVDLSCADLILLMFELNDELDQIGAPFTPS
jgi:hypothetical protein